jgi:membrane protein
VAAARAPVQVPWRGWKDVFVRTYREIQNDRLLALAAGVAFYSLVALFPAIAAGVSSYALFANVATIGKHLSIASDIIPAGSLDLLGAEISRIAAKSDGKLTFGFLVGLGIALWDPPIAIAEKKSGASRRGSLTFCNNFAVCSFSAKI